MFVKNQFENLHQAYIWICGKAQRYLLSLPVIQKTVYKAYMSDEKYLSKSYKKLFGKSIDFNHPKSFNEKNNWRKLYDRKEIYTSMVDKYLLKSIVAEKAGEQYVIPLLGVWDKPKDIAWETLPDQFVLKCNHAGGVAICRDRRNFNRRCVVGNLRRKQRTDYYLKHREWPYKNVQRKIIAEEYAGENLIDYKNYCFNGQVQFTFVWKNHAKRNGFKPHVYFCGAYDRKWNKTGIEIDYPTEDAAIDKPVCYEEMVRVAEKMAEGIPFVRVDCYIINSRVYVGEMTFFPYGGFQKFKDEKWDLLLGEMEKLPGID